MEAQPSHKLTDLLEVAKVVIGDLTDDVFQRELSIELVSAGAGQVAWFHGGEELRVSLTLSRVGFQRGAGVATGKPGSRRFVGGKGRSIIFSY